MIAVVSSTSFPSSQPIYDGNRTWVNPSDRLEQTRQTLDSLLRLGVTDIYLADNSGKHWVAGTENALRPAKVYVFNQYQLAE